MTWLHKCNAKCLPKFYLGGGQAFSSSTQLCTYKKSAYKEFAHRATLVCCFLLAYIALRATCFNPCHAPSFR